MEFQPKYKEAKVRMGFDLSSDLDTNETLSTNTFTITSVNAKDPDMASMLVGSASEDNGSVSILIQNGKAGYSYELCLQSVTSSGRKIVAKKIFEVV